MMKHGVPQGSVLGPLLFLIYFNDKAIKYCTVHHFADHTNLIISNNPPKQIQKHLNLDLKNPCKWLRANKISLNASKTELLIFRHPNNKLNYGFKIKLDGKKLHPSKYVKYLGVLIDSHLNFSYHINSTSTKLSRAIGLLSKIRHYDLKDILRSIYFGIFSPMLTYASQIWGQIKSKHFTRLITLHMAIKILNSCKFSASPLYKVSKILKISDNIRLQDFLLVYVDLHGTLPPAMKNTFKLTASLHAYLTHGTVMYNVKSPDVKTTAFDLRSVKFQCCQGWNFFIHQFKTISLLNKTVSHFSLVFMRQNSKSLFPCLYATKQ